MSIGHIFFPRELRCIIGGVSMVHSLRVHIKSNLIIQCLKFSFFGGSKSWYDCIS
jgi:hypothetical protein